MATLTPAFEPSLQRDQTTRQLNVRLPVPLKQRLDAVSAETVLSCRTILIYALTQAIREAESNRERFIGRVANSVAKAKQEEREGLR